MLQDKTFLVIFKQCVKNVSLAYSKSLDGRYGENDEWLQCLEN